MEDGLDGMLKGPLATQRAKCRMDGHNAECECTVKLQNAGQCPARGTPMRFRMGMRVRSKAVWGLAALGAIALAGACGGGGMSPSGVGTPPPNTTITITSSGVSPKNLVVSAGTQVTFVNNSLATREIFSDPHPTHTDCPEINTVGSIAPGQSKQTDNLNIRRTCGYHDHILFSNPSLQGTITIQ